MKAVEQEGPFGCGVACTASILDIDYQEALNLFQDGRRKHIETGFYCGEIVDVLVKAGLNYKYKHFEECDLERINTPGTIIFLRKSDTYPHGHYLCRVSHANRWADSWINFPDEDRKSGFRELLPGEPEYIIYCTD